MKDIRTQVLNFASNADGTRVWARKHRISADGKRLDPLIVNYNWRGQSYVCADVPGDWEYNTHVILTDNIRSNDFKGQNKAARLACNINVGECWDLAYAALQAHNGLTRVSNYAGSGRIWSNKKLSSLNGVSGGEILEINKSTYFFKFRYGKDDQGNITSFSPSGNSTDSRFPHTAIIDSVDKSTGVVEVYHQNFADNRLVHSYEFPLTNQEYDEMGEKVLQTCGGSAVKRFTTRLKSFNITATNFNYKSKQSKLKGLIKDMETHIKSFSGLSNRIAIYVPQAP